MTKQETFDTVVSHLLKQGKATNWVGKGRTAPAYYATSGRRCAVGCLIPPAEYNPSFEGVGVLSIYLQCPSLQQHDPHLLSDLQELHDSCPTKRWESRIAKIAKIHNLDYSPPTN